MVLYPQQLDATAICGCFVRLPCDVTFINEVDLQRLGPVDLVIAGWPNKGHSHTGTDRGLENLRSSLFEDFIRFMQWWYAHQPSSPRYIFENVSLLGDYRDKVLESRHCVCQHLGDPIFVDAADLGSSSHRPRWL